MAGLGFTQGEHGPLPTAGGEGITALLMPSYGGVPMADFETARRRMVDNQLRTSNVTDRRILTAMGEVPRELFVPAERQDLAYADTAHALGHGRSLAPPAPFAKLIQLAEIEHTDSVLDVGAGTGYSTAVLARLAASVVGLESDPTLVARARDLLANAYPLANAKLVEGPLDGAGQPPEAYDVILLEGAVDAAPASLFLLLRHGGRLVALLRRGGTGVAHVYVKSGAGIATRTEFNTALPPLAASPREESFVF